MPRGNTSLSKPVYLYAERPTPEPPTLLLRGIFWIKNQPVALINDQTLAVDESRKVRLGTTNVLVRCLAITDESVRVRILDSGDERELKMKPRR